MKIAKKKRPTMSLPFLAFEALKKAVANTIADHARTGDPIAIWRDGKAVLVPADSIGIRGSKEASRVRKRNGKTSGVRRRD